MSPAYSTPTQLHKSTATKMASNDSANGRAVVDLTQDDQDHERDSDVEITAVRVTPGGRRRRFRNAVAPPPRVYGRAYQNENPCIKCVRRVMYGRSNIRQIDLLCTAIERGSHHCAACIEDTACFIVYVRLYICW